MFSLGHFSPEPRSKFSSGYPGLLALHVVMRALLRENTEKDSCDVFKVRKRSFTRREARMTCREETACFKHCLGAAVLLGDSCGGSPL